MSRYAANPLCWDCGRKKGPNQVSKLRCFTCQKIFDRKAKETSHASYILRTYGITAETYKALLAFQGGKCAICARATGRTRRLAVDHDHSCKEGHPPKLGCEKCVRGLLCSVCNVFIGRMHDNPDVGNRMSRYLRSAPMVELRAGRAPAAILRRLPGLPKGE